MWCKKLAGFVSCLEGSRGEVIADFQQYYGISLPLEGEVSDLERMSLLWYQLPAQSRTARAQEPSNEWGVAEYLLWLIEFNQRQLIWALSNDPKNPAPAPEPLMNPAKLAEAHANKDLALDARGEIDEILGMGVDHG